MKSAAITLESGIQEALTYTSYPLEHWLKIRSNNGIERINREIWRQTNAVGAFPDGNSALMLVCFRLRFVSALEWGVKTYLNMQRLYELERERESEKIITSARSPPTLTACGSCSADIPATGTWEFPNNSPTVVGLLYCDFLALQGQATCRRCLPGHYYSLDGSGNLEIFFVYLHT